MELILLRHGKAEDSNPAGDHGRNLVEKGRRQSRDAAVHLRAAGLLPEIVLTSPLNRARQTAGEFCTAGGLSAPIVANWLASGMLPETALNELVGFREFNRIAIVGHEPDFSELIQWLLGARGGSIEVRKGALACLRIYPPAKIGTLLYLAPPSLTGD
jgi:phosphohistidine phosphatase